MLIITVCGIAWEQKHVSLNEIVKNIYIKLFVLKFVDAKMF